MSLKATNNVETNKYELEIEISAEDFEAAIQKAYLKAKKNISIPGFRKGKAPRKLIRYCNWADLDLLLSSWLTRLIVLPIGYLCPIFCENT